MVSLSYTNFYKLLARQTFSQLYYPWVCDGCVGDAGLRAVDQKLKLRRYTQESIVGVIAFDRKFLETHLLCLAKKSIKRFTEKIVTI